MTREGTHARMKIEANAKLEDTSIEIALDRIAEGIGLKLIKPEVFWEDGWPIRPDRQIEGTNIVIECDGEYYHRRTPKQCAKEDWKDNAELKMGKRVLRIPGSLLVAQGVGDSKKFWPYVSLEILAFMKSSEPVKRVLA